MFANPRAVAEAYDYADAPPGRIGWSARFGLATTFAALLVHAHHYRFLTDDAYISFRYARNLSQGAGLVFNPGYEAVEGYSNFLWVILLTAFDRLGIPPHDAAIPLSLLCTAGLWAAVAVLAARYAPEDHRGASAVVATGLLAATPSVAVWSTSGLETRLFELLIVSGVLRLLVEDDALRLGRRIRPLAALCFALATLTRPDGGIAAGALAAAVLWRARDLRARLPWILQSAATYGFLVGAHFGFRRIYYGAWLPNTYYAKISGQSWWELGTQYLEAFALEHAVYLWIPLLVAGVVYHARRGSGLLPIVFAAVCVPHLVYIAVVGGDHFEYRLLDLVFAFAFVLMAQGLAATLCRGSRWAAAAAVWVVLVTVAGWEIPTRAHREFPDRYIPAFPGGRADAAVAASYLDPSRGAVHGTWGLRELAARHRGLLDVLTRHFAGLRREEHAQFLARVEVEGKTLRALVERGVLPVDTYVAICCVGAIPYYSKLRTLDRLGLTDAEVARGEITQPLLVGHSRSASRRYGRARGVDFWSVDPVHLLFNGRDPGFARSLVGMHQAGRDIYFAHVGSDVYLVAELLQGIEAARRKFPLLDFQNVRDPEAVQRTLGRLAGPAPGRARPVRSDEAVGRGQP